MTRIAVLLCALTVVLTVAVLAQDPQGAPNNINVQGKLTTSGGGDVTAGNYTLSFRIFDAPIGGTQIWPAAGDEDHLLAIGTDGVWTALLGKDGGLNVGTMDDTTRWLEVTVTPPIGSSETFSRIKLSSNPFTLEAGQLNGRTGDEYVEVAGDLMEGTLSFDFNNDATTDAFLRQDGGSTTLLELHGAGGVKAQVVGEMKGHVALYDSDGTATATLDATANAGGVLQLRTETGSSGATLYATGTNSQLQLVDGSNIYSRIVADDKGTLTLADNSGDATAILDASLATGGVLDLNHEDGTNGVLLQAGTTTSGSTLRMHNDASSTAVFLDAQESLGGLLLLNKETGASGMELQGGSTLEGAQMAMRNAAGGATIVMDADLTGTSAVQFPGGAISAAEVLDEPGIASINNSIALALAAGLQNVDLRSITAPSSGYVLVIGTATVQLSHTNGTQTFVELGVSEVSGVLPATQDGDIIIPSAAPTGSWYQVVTVQSIFDVTAGAHTFYLVANELGGSVLVSNRQLSVIFFPTAHGTYEDP